MSTTLDFPLEVRSINGDSGEFEGYASVFDVVDSYETVMARGAFKESLQKWESMNRYPAMLWQHRTDEPIGIYTHMKEDQKGLYVKGRLLVKDDLTAKRAYGHIKAGSINGLSVGFISESESFDEKRGVAVINKVNLMEVSLVTFPSNASAIVTNVREALSNGEIPSPKEVEKVLRDAGFSRNQAKTILAKGYGALTPRDAEERAAIYQLNEMIKTWSFKDGN